STSIRTSFSDSLATRTPITPGFGTRARFGSIRSSQGHAICLPSTKNRPSPSGSSVVSGSARTIRRTSAGVAIAPVRGLILVRIAGGVRRGRDGLAQVARLHDRRLAVAILPAGLDLDLLGLALEAEHDVEPRSAVAHRLDGGIVRRERQQGDHLAEIAPKLVAEVADRPGDIPRDSSRAQCPVELAKGCTVLE